MQINKISLLILSAIIALLFSGCVGFNQPPNTGTINIEIPPKLIASLDINGNPRIVDGSVLEDYFVKITQDWDSWPSFRYDDSKFVVVTDDSMRAYISWAQRLRTQLNIKYIKNARDCENFAAMLMVHASIAGLDDPGIEAQILIGIIVVTQKNDWARVEGSGGGHALNFYFSDKGLFVVEPQATGAITGLEEYPNKHFINRVEIGY